MNASLVSAVAALLALMGSWVADAGPSAFKAQPMGEVTTRRLLNADQEPQNWFNAGRDFREQHYSPLSQINAGNVAQLGFAWEYPILFRGRVLHGLEATPQVIDGVIFTSGPWGTVYAVDAQTGRELWRYDPDVDGSWARRTCCGVVNRGVAVWSGRVYVGTVDGYLVALEAHTGKVLWTRDTFVDRNASYSITGAPLIANGKVVIGNAGADMGARGYLSAYDAATGRFVWRFYTVPGNPAKGFEQPELKQAARTWSANSEWALGGGGTAWGYMAWDPQLNLLYVGTGNGLPWPVWRRSPGGGDNLFLSSILAINPDTGRLVWHYQTTPGDSWDYTATQNIILADLDIQGKPRKVLMQAPKNGFFYVLDRVTGELLSANQYAPVNWASRIDLKTGRPVPTGQGNYQNEPKVIMPGPGGAHNWFPMSFSPMTGLVYIPVVEAAALFVNESDFEPAPKSWNLGAEFYYGPPFPQPYANYAKGYEHIRFGLKLKAWDPVTRREAWSAAGSSAGTLSTAGDLVVQGTPSGQLVVYAAKTGAKLKVIETGTPITAAPMSYAVEGQQYFAVMASGRGAPSHTPSSDSHEYQNTPRILAFTLGGGTTPLPPLAARVTLPQPPPLMGTNTERERGKGLYARYCLRCHRESDDAIQWGYPDLTRMLASTHALFNRIVLDGIYSSGGMASFADVLKEDDVEAIHAYLIELAWQHFDKEQQSSLRSPHEMDLSSAANSNAATH